MSLPTAGLGTTCKDWVLTRTAYDNNSGSNSRIILGTRNMSENAADLDRALPGKGKSCGLFRVVIPNERSPIGCVQNRTIF